MNLTCFPNNEIRIRIPAPVVAKHRQGAGSFYGAIGPSILTIAKKLRQTHPEAVKIPRVKALLRPGYGGIARPTGFSVRGRRMLVRAGALIGRDRYQHPVLFLTGTLPGGTPSAFQAIANHSAFIVHELLTHLPRLAGSSAKDCRFLWVWEWQKRGALHWHCVIETPTRKGAAKILRGFKKLWIRVLETVEKKAGIDIAERAEGGSWAGNYRYWQVKAERARKRPDRYLSKYLSKGFNTPSANFPTRWYGVSRSLHRELSESIQRFSTHETESQRHVLNDSDLSLIDKIIKDSYLVRNFADKVGEGYTFVCYLEDEKMNEALRIFGDLNRTMELKGKVYIKPDSICAYQGMSAVSESAFLQERFVADLGNYYRVLYYKWLDGDDPVPESELFWLEYYARRLLFVTGLTYEGQPPERSGAGLPSRNEPKIEPMSPPELGNEQSSLFP